MAYWPAQAVTFEVNNSLCHFNAVLFTCFSATVVHSFMNYWVNITSNVLPIEDRVLPTLSQRELPRKRGYHLNARLPLWKKVVLIFASVFGVMFVTQGRRRK